MNLCPRCGGTHDGPTCPPGDVPRQETLNAVVTIEQKINRTRFHEVPVVRWVERGCLYGLGVSLLLGPLVFLGWVLSIPLQPIWITPGTYFGSLVVTLLTTAFACLLVGAAVSVLVMGVFRPIYMAVFRSIDDWEQEYGDRRPRLPPLDPSARDAS